MQFVIRFDFAVLLQTRLKVGVGMLHVIDRTIQSIHFDHSSILAQADTDAFSGQTNKSRMRRIVVQPVLECCIPLIRVVKG
jgi:hypothetical protein